jgi:hypothetical protein
MKRRTISGLLLGLAATASAEAFAAPSASAGTAHGGGRGFERFLRRYEAANTAFQNGDPTLWLSLTAEKDPVSIFGGFGGLGEAGVATVHQRYLLAAPAFQPSGATVDFQYMVKDVRGDLAYTVAIERSHVLYAGAHRAAPPGSAGDHALPLRAWVVADRSPARGYDGRPRTSRRPQ